MSDVSIMLRVGIDGTSPEARPANRKYRYAGLRGAEWDVEATGYVKVSESLMLDARDPAALRRLAAALEEAARSLDEAIAAGPEAEVRR